MPENNSTKLLILLEWRRGREGTPAAALHRCGAPATSSTPTWQAILRSPKSRASADVSASYFVRAFKQATGLPPHRWLTKQRVERAKELLRDPSQGLFDIAQLFGFVDQSHFTRVFFQERGLQSGGIGAAFTAASPSNFCIDSDWS